MRSTTVITFQFTDKYGYWMNYFINGNTYEELIFKPRRRTTETQRDLIRLASVFQFSVELITKNGGFMRA